MRLRSLFVLSFVACSGSIHSRGNPDGAQDGVVSDGSSDGPLFLIDGASPDAPVTCGPTLASRFSLTPIDGTGGTGAIFAAPMPDGGTVVAWRDTDGVHLTLVNAADERAGDDIVTTGNAPHGLAAHEGGIGLLYFRGEDELLLRSVTTAGVQRFETRLLGAVPHNVTNNEWFGPLIQQGRLAWTGSAWAAYFTVQRLWGDGIEHYGDQLLLLNDSGAVTSTVWDWGCSHSMEVRISHNGTSLGPVCASDCYPTKGVHFYHDTEIYPDPGSNCFGVYEAHLGGIVPDPDGFWLGYTSPHGRPARDAAIVHVTNARAVGAIHWLTKGAGADGLRLAHYYVHLLAGWTEAGMDRFQTFDFAGTPASDVEVVTGAALSEASDFFAHGTDGDVGWATRVGGQVAIARIQSCPGD